MTQTPTKTQFPDPAESPWENPDNGLTYKWNGWGWDIATSDDPADPDEPKPEGLRYRYKAVNYGDFADVAGTIGIATGPDDGDVDTAPLIALSAINFDAPDLAGSASPGFSENQHELFICALDKDTGVEGTFRVQLKDGGQKGHRKGFVNANSWYSTPDNINIEVGSEIELIFAPIAKAALEDSGVEIHEGLPDEPYEEGDLYFDVSDDELTLYIYVGGDWVPAAPPVSLDGIENDLLSLQEANNDVKRQLAYHTVEAQKTDLKILDLEESTKALEKTTEELHENQEAHAAQIDYNARENTKLRSRIGDVEHTVQSLEGSSPRRVFRFEWMGFGQSKPQNQAEFDQRKGKAWSEYSSEDKWINIHAEDQDGNLLVLPNFAKSYASMPIALCEEGATGDPTKDPKVLIDGRAAPIISDIDQSEREKTGNFQGIDARYFDAYVMHLTSSISKLKKNKIYTLTFGLPL